MQENVFEIYFSKLWTTDSPKGWPTHENKKIPANLLIYYMFFQPNQHEKHTFFQHDHKKSLKNLVKHLKDRIHNNSNKDNDITAIVDKTSSY